MTTGIREGLAGLALTVALAVSTVPGCVSIREGDEQISAAVSPFGASVVEQRYESGTNKIIGRKVMDITTAFGNIHREVKFYGSDGKYRGGYKVKYDGVFGENPKISTEVYDSSGKTVRVIDREEDVDLDARESVEKK